MLIKRKPPVNGRKYIVLTLSSLCLQIGCLAIPTSAWLIPCSNKQLKQAVLQSPLVAYPSKSPKHTKATKALLLLHGLGERASQLDVIAKQLAAKFGGDLLIINPRCRDGICSIVPSTKAQARAVYRYVQYVLRQHGKDPTTFPIIVNGYSQGGVLACIFCTLYKDKLNISGMVATTTPLMGLPLLERNYRDIQLFLAQKGWQLLPYAHCLNRSLRNLRLRLNAGILALARWRWSSMLLAGLKDLAPNSGCIQEVSTFLQDQTHAIPCLFIAGYHYDLSNLLNLTLANQHKETMMAFNHAYAWFITGYQGSYHDTLVPLSSQLLLSDADLLQFPGHAMYVMQPMPNQPHIQRCICRDVVHATGLIAVDLNLPVDESKTIYHSPYALDALIGFIQNCVTPLADSCTK